MSAVADPDATLRTEEEQRRLAAIAAFIGGILAVAWFATTLASLAGAERRSLLVSLPRLEGDEPIGAQQSLRLDTFQFFADRGAAQIIAAVFLALSSLGAAYALIYLARATQARAERFSKMTIYLPAIGGVIAAVSTLMIAIASYVFYNDGADSAGTVDALSGARPGGVYQAGDFMRYFSTLAVGLGFILVGLSAMRVGLLTRFMGVMCIFGGALVILPPPSALVVQTFWLIAFGFLVLRMWPGGAIPPAWVTGRAEPWPSASADRQARQQAALEKRAKRRGEAPPAPPEPEAVEARAAAAKPHPTSKKKRKRRD